MNSKAKLHLAFLKLAAQQSSEDDGKANMVKHLLAASGAALGTEAASGMANSSYMNWLGDLKSNGSAAHKNADDFIRNILSNKGIDVLNKRQNPITGSHIHLDHEPFQAAYDPAMKKLYVGNNLHPGIIAHEAGHAVAPTWLTAANVIGKNAGGLGSLYSLFGTRDKQHADNAAMLSGTAIGLGTLPSEIDASRRGFNMLHGLPFKDRLHSFMGIPTYLLASVAPYLAVQLKNALGGYNKTNEPLR